MSMLNPSRRHQSAFQLPKAFGVALHCTLGLKDFDVFREVALNFGRGHDVASMGMMLSPAIVPATSPVPFAKHLDAGCFSLLN